MFLKEKRGGNFKGRACADGQKQREGSQKKDAIYPVVELELVFITSAIGAHESRDVDVVDIPG